LFLHEQFCHNRHRGYIKFSKGGKMERKKIIAVAALAVGIVAWRMGAMQGEHGQMIALVTNDGKKTSIAKDRAMLFGTVKDLMEDLPDETEIPVKIETQAALQAVVDDIPWVLRVLGEKRADETEQQAVERIVKIMPVAQNNLQNLMVKVNGAIYLNQQALIEKYAKEIADILVSDDSMRRLARNDTTILAGIRGEILEKCSHYIVNDFWFNVLTLDSNYPVRSASFSWDGSKIVTASSWVITIWNAQTGVLEHTLGHVGVVNSASFSPDGSKIVTSYDFGTAKIWNAQTGALERTLAGHTGNVKSASFSPDGSKIVTASWDRTAKIWNANTGAEEHTLVGHRSVVKSASFSPDGSKIVTASGDGTAMIWNAQTGALEHTIGHNFEVLNSASFSPDSSKVVTACYSGRVKIWNATTGTFEHRLEGHNLEVNSASYSPDGSKIVTASNDRTAKIWNARTGALQCTLIGHTDWVLSASFSPAASFSPVGSKIVTASKDKTAKIFVRLPSSLPGISDFETCLFERLLTWAKMNHQKISKQGWVGDILSGTTWRDVEPNAKKELQTLIRETMEHVGAQQ
jgi:tricorn protease-like protein